MADWADLNAKGLSAEQLVRLYSVAIHTIEQRSLATLSSVTLMVVVDRALYTTKSVHSCLAVIKATPVGLDLGELSNSCSGLKPQELNDALQSLLVVLLTVLGNITADILSAPLHKALAEVSAGQALQASELQQKTDQRFKKQPFQVVKPIKRKREES